jgi:hypothetical protein
MLCGFQQPMRGVYPSGVGVDSELPALSSGWMICAERRRWRRSCPAMDGACIPSQLVTRPSWRQRRALRLLGVVFSMVDSVLVGISEEDEQGSDGNRG